MATNPIFQFKAELSDFKPKIWRRFQVANHISLARLAYIVMTMFEMEASHLFAVEVFAVKDVPGKELPRVLDDEGFGIIEDCGGPDGLTRLARSFSKKKGTEYEENRRWLGVDDLDLAAFDVADMNFRAKKIPLIYADIYEKDLPPTKASIELLTRKYKTS